MESEAFTEEHNLNVVAVAEAGLHGKRSRTICSIPLTFRSIHNTLRVPGFEIAIPESCYSNYTACLYMYFKSSIQFKIVKNPDTHDTSYPHHRSKERHVCNHCLNTLLQVHGGCVGAPHSRGPALAPIASYGTLVPSSTCTVEPLSTDSWRH